MTFCYNIVFSLPIISFTDKDMDKLKMGYIKSAAIPFGVAIISVLVIRLIRMKFYAATCVNCQGK